MAVTTKTLRQKKGAEPITMLTAYDSTTAKILDEAGVDVILVGDSVGNTMLGFDTTVPVTIDMMAHHVSAVSRVVKNAFVLADMPFLSVGIDIASDVRNAGRLLQEAGANAVKIEGHSDHILELTRRLVSLGIPVVSHLGLTPQSVNEFGGYSMRAKTKEEQDTLVSNAIELQDAGAFMILVEVIPPELAERLTTELEVPLIGIGCKHPCDGQVLVINDILGLNFEIRPKFAKIYADLKPQIEKAAREYIKEVKNKEFY